MNDATVLELARLFIGAWDMYCDDATEDLHELLVGTELVQEHEVTQEDKDAEKYEEWDVEDIIYVLSPMGKEVQDLVNANAPERT